MAPEIQIILSGTLTFGVPLAVAVRELLVTRRRGGSRPERLPEPVPRKPLPPCLIQPPQPARPQLGAICPRVLEDA